MDNNHSDFVMVFIGDLGHLSHDEQMHWRSFNLPAKGKMSYTAWVRGFEGNFANPEKSDLFLSKNLLSSKLTGRRNLDGIYLSR